MAESEILHILITIAVLLFAAKLMAKLVVKMGQSAVLGEIIAGIIISPFALGGLPLVNGEPLVVIDETILHIGEIAAIIILFVAGMNTTPREFMKLGAPSFTVGALGVIVPFFVGYFVFTALDVEVLPAIIIATALTATSIAISVQVLNELGRLGTREGRLILGAAVADDVLGIAVLSVVLTMVNTGNVSPDIPNVTFLLLQILGIYAAILVVSVVAVPRLLNSRLWGPKGSQEVAATAACFAISGAAAFAGLSPIVGAFAAGLATTTAKAFHKIREYAEKLDVLFAPLFFVIIGARVDLRGVNTEVLILSGVIIAIAVVTKLVGCGLPAMLFLKDRNKSMKVGIGMISRGEVGLIVAAAGASAGVLSGGLYTTVVIMVAVSTIITPVWLKFAYRKDPPEPPAVVEQKPQS
ncbi:cation:proton antiporter [Candidatus Nitrososphaera sp. FF02]|uniref:cation:proton antiporter n=1 Tax=Candidatus Nitrososphaera sp. FF02 TaxID=3398226 RepID=UPI0039ECB05E